jgi:hypothetical protein
MDETTNPCEGIINEFGPMIDCPLSVGHWTGRGSLPAVPHQSCFSQCDSYAVADAALDG